MLKPRSVKSSSSQKCREILVLGQRNKKGILKEGGFRSNKFYKGNETQEKNKKNKGLSLRLRRRRKKPKQYPLSSFTSQKHLIPYQRKGDFPLLAGCGVGKVAEGGRQSFSPGQRASLQKQG